MTPDQVAGLAAAEAVRHRTEAAEIDLMRLPEMLRIQVAPSLAR